MTRPTSYAIVLSIGKITIGPLSDIPSVLDGVWLTVLDTQMPVEIIDDTPVEMKWVPKQT